MNEGRAGYLLLEDGRRFSGLLRGAVPLGLPAGDSGPGVGEVVFQTGMTGYQEVLTDPSYRGQIVTFTAPHIGNTGVNDEDAESPEPALAGIVVRSMTDTPSSWRSRGSLDEYLRAHGVPALTEVDTRALTRHLRTQGSMRGVLVPGSVAPEQARERVKAFPGLSGRNLVAEVVPGDTSRAPSTVARPDEFPPPPEPLPGRPRITVIHCGMKEGIAVCLESRGARIRIVPPDATAAEILAGSPSGLVLSNGPGDPEDVGPLVATVRSVLGRLPILGICLGHQVLGRALGARTYKLPFGHHGINHPVRDLSTDAVLVTSQNHGFAVDADSLRTGAGGDVAASAIPTHISLNDGTLEGFAVPDLRVSAVQFHPEARSGPHDARYLFDRFVSSLSPAESDDDARA